MAGHLLSVQVLGTSFSLKSDENLDYLEEVVDYYKRKVEETQKSVPLSDPLKIALLTGIIVTDELMKERSKGGLGLSKGEAEEAERITKTLIERIDSILS